MEIDYNNRLLYVYKPLSWTSNDVLRWLKRRYKLKKAGHGGTLDPLAEGMLVVGTGQKTKTLESVTKKSKEYIACFCLGAGSKTGDLEMNDGRINPDLQITKKQVLDIIKAKFLGSIKQKPPVYSAKKIHGQRAYDIIRKGGEINLEAVEVKIKEFEVLGLDAFPRFCNVFKKNSNQIINESDSLQISLQLVSNPGQVLDLKRASDKALHVAENSTKIYPKIFLDHREFDSYLDNLDYFEGKEKYINLKAYKGWQKLDLSKTASPENINNAAQNKIKGLYYMIARLKVSKGTYIRAIARDLGIALGTEGFLVSLLRTAYLD